MGSLGFLLSCDGHLREPRVLPQGCHVSFQVVRVCVGLLSSLCWRIGPHLELRWETQGYFPVSTGISGFLSCFNRGGRPHLVFRHGAPLSSRVVKGLSGLLSSSGREFGLFLDMQQGSQTSLHIVWDTGGSIQVGSGESGPISS